MADPSLRVRSCNSTSVIHRSARSVRFVRSTGFIQFFSPEKISFEKLERDGNGCTVEEREKVYIYTQRGARSENLPDRSDLDFTG